MAACGLVALESADTAGWGGMRILLISRAMLAAPHRARAHELAKLGVHLTVVVPKRWEYQQFEGTEGQEEKCDIRVSHLGFAQPILGRLAHHTFYYRQLSRIIDECAWDVVHIDEEPFNFACYHAMTLCSRANLKCVFFTWQNILKKYPPPFNIFETSVFEKASAAIAGNVDAERILRQRGFSKPISVISQFAVNPELFCKLDRETVRRKLGFEGGLIVGYIGRIVREKGLETLVRAFARLPRTSTLVIVGSGPFEGALKAMISSLGISGRTHWVRWVSSGNVMEYMNAFDALVLPSLTTPSWKEQFGRVLVEAMACETCVVGSDSGEIPNVIGDAGLVFHEGDERGLADRLGWLMDDPSLRETLGRQGRARVIDCFAYSKVARNTLALYNKVCSERPAGHARAYGLAAG